MTIDEMKKIEPGLVLVEFYAKSQNEKAKNNEIYWFKLWHELKYKLRKYVGDDAQNELLSESKYWDMWHDYLCELTPNCK